ncbi:MAG: HAMP domain-containing protein [Planctomycetia bacterium]|nr:HAMP domain-containing protein [Planctomycetia bacterium]
MTESPAEIKPALARFFWIQFLSFGLVFVPLAVAAVLWSIFALEVPTANALVGLAVFGGVALAAMAVVAYVNARRIVNRLESVHNVVGQMAKGEFDKRIPAANRQQIEDLAASFDQTQRLLKVRVEDLEASRNQLRTVLDSMVEGVIAVDRDQKVLLVNEAGRRLFPIQDLAPVGRPVWELVRSPQLANWVAQSLLQSEPVGGELEIKAPVPRILSVRVAGLPGPTIAGAIVVASDISQLRRLERVRQEFVANASHELKTPLASIKACVETLLDGALEDAEIRVRFLQTVNEQSERLDRLIRDLLALTRIESEAERPALHPVDVAEIVALCVNRQIRNAERKGMQLVSAPPAAPVRVLADEEPLEQILDNLIDNAIKYTNSGGTITIRWEVPDARTDARCRIEVEDTGIGIPQAHQVRIFERFYRVDRARSRELGGTGLGLSIVKHLVQQMGGTISVSSRLGKGSTFTVDLGAAS